jgi:hypothetical protein
MAKYSALTLDTKLATASPFESIMAMIDMPLLLDINIPNAPNKIIHSSMVGTRNFLLIELKKDPSFMVIDLLSIKSPYIK